jgi:primosomal protein N' (replication factor Y) (superfamily II helicase)
MRLIASRTSLWIVPPFLLLLEWHMFAELPALSSPAPDVLYADVIVPRHLAGPFTYLVPLQLRPILRVGHLVLVPFGRSVIQGAVIALTQIRPQTVASGQLKEIRTLAGNDPEPDIPPNLLDLARRVAEAYVAPWGQCLRLVMPPTGITRPDARRFLLTNQGREALATKAIVSKDVQELLERLKRRPRGIRCVTLCKNKDRRGDTLLASLVEQGWIQEAEEPAATHGLKPGSSRNGLSRDLYASVTFSLERTPSYPPEWEARILQMIERRQPMRLLVQAPVHERLALLRYALQRTVTFGRTGLVIVGEAERAESIAAALSQGGTMAAVCHHSGLSDQRKAEIWDQVRQQSVRVVVGTRSAVFLPLHSLGLIWVEREEDQALKEPQEPRYHAREVAWLRARDDKALLVMGSTHASLETMMNMEQQGSLLRQSPAREGTPAVEVVDLREEHRGTILSPPLVEAMRSALARNAGALLFLNRKGYAGALVCRDCGQVPRCPSCRVAFTYYRHKGSLLCSYCGTTTSIPDVCASCAGSRLQLIGEGTERVEEEVKRLFPRAAVLRIDGETMRKSKQASVLWNRIRQREWDILVGTQLILRDDAVPAVDVVGLVQADAGLSLPDFRAAERTYHILTDAVGLARPSSAGGRVILQSYLPSHHAIQAVVQQDEAIFRSEELSHRTVLGYPPAVHLIALHVSGVREGIVHEAASAWVASLSPPASKRVASQGLVAQSNGNCHSDGLTVLGPVPSPVPKLRGRHRRQILVKSHSRDVAIQAVRRTVRDLEKVYPSRMVKFDVDVDPLEMR